MVKQQVGLVGLLTLLWTSSPTMQSQSFSDNFDRQDGAVGNGWGTWNSTTLSGGEVVTRGADNVGGGIYRAFPVTYPVQFAFDFRTQSPHPACDYGSNKPGGGWLVAFNGRGHYSTAHYGFLQYYGSSPVVRFYRTQSGQFIVDSRPSGLADFGASPIRISGNIDADLSATLTVGGRTYVFPPVAEPLATLGGDVVLSNSSCGGGPFFFDNFSVSHSASEAGIRFDANRDGRVSFADPADNTTQGQPFRFWLNNDHDNVTEDLDPSDPSLGRADASDGRIETLRDLEDFAKLAISLPKGIDLSSPQTRVAISLRASSGTPALNIFRAAAEGDQYLHDAAIGNQQLALGQISRRVDATEVDLPLALFATSNTARFLIEGVSTGCGEVTVQVYSASAAVSTHRAYICLHDFRDFYDHSTTGTFEADPNRPETLTPESLWPVHFTDQEILRQATCDYVTFVHGWRLHAWERRAFAETSFKRLWHFGYRGRFALFSWPTGWIAADTFWDAILRALWPVGIKDNYAASEYVAWQSAAELRTFLGAQWAKCPGHVRVLAHSMGNVVTSEALRLEAESAQPRVLAHTYVASQAVTPAGAYDSFSGATLDFYSRYPPTAMPYFSTIGSAAGRVVNYFNRDDVVLTLLGTHNGLKPFFNSALFPNGCYFPLLFRTLTFPADTHLIYSTCARASSDPLGQTGQVGGTISRSLDLGRAFVFGSARDDHSAQFNREIQTRGPYWKALLEDLSLPGSIAATCLPSAPTAFRASVSGHVVHLAWTPPAGQLRGHLVDVGSASGLTDLTTVRVDSPSTGVSATGPTGRYFLRVSAVSSCGTGPASNEIVVDVPSSCSTPTAPSSLTFSIDGRNVTLGWAPASNAAAYVVEAGSASGLADLASADVGFVTGLSTAVPPGTYYVRVRGVNACGQLGPSSTEIVVSVN